MGISLVSIQRETLKKEKNWSLNTNIRRNTNGLIDITRSIEIPFKKCSSRNEEEKKVIMLRNNKTIN
jgi:hypothetical protein